MCPAADIIPLRPRKQKPPSRRRKQEAARLLEAFGRASPEHRELLLEVVRGLRQDFLPEAPDSPDGELIRLCKGLVAVNTAATAVCYLTDDEQARAPIEGKLCRRRTEIERRLYKSPLPSTPEGARAAAKAMLSELPSDCIGKAIQNADLAGWLGVGLAKYLTRFLPPQERA